MYMYLYSECVWHLLRDNVYDSSSLDADQFPPPTLWCRVIALHGFPGNRRGFQGVHLCVCVPRISTNKILNAGFWLMESHHSLMLYSDCQRFVFRGLCRRL